MSNFGFRWSFNPKVHQRAVNKVVRELNKNIENDNLWQGRFFMRQYARKIVSFGNEGMLLWLEMRLYDKKTKRYVRWFCDSNDVIIWGGSKTWRRMNDFIVEDLDVWHNEDPRNEKYNWRAVSAEKIIREAIPLRDW